MSRIKTESEELHEAVVDARSAYHAAISAYHAALLESRIITDSTYAIELAASDDAADAFVKAKWALDGKDATAYGKDATAYGKDATAYGEDAKAYGEDAKAYGEYYNYFKKIREEQKA